MSGQWPGLESRISDLSVKDISFISGCKSQKKVRVGCTSICLLFETVHCLYSHEAAGYLSPAHSIPLF